MLLCSNKIEDHSFGMNFHIRIALSPVVDTVVIES